MSIDFSDYVQCLDENDHEHAEALHSSYHEAQRVMSPRGLDNYLQGMRAMCTLNRAASEVMQEVGVHACTDVTGFGLAGHALNVARASVVGLRIAFERLPSGRRNAMARCRKTRSNANAIACAAPRWRSAWCRWPALVAPGTPSR